MLSFIRNRNKKDEILKVNDDIASYCKIVYDYFTGKSKVVNKLANDRCMIDFLKSCNNDTYTIKHENYPDLIRTLKNVKEQNAEIYLAFLGIKCNEDAVDNYGRSRQHECFEKLRDSYIVSKRAWYIETMNSKNMDTPTITLPYRDTSGSYVISITKPIKDEKGKYLGMVGIDVLVRNIALKLNTEQHIIIFTESGEIVYNSETYIRDVLEKRYNIMLILEPGMLELIKAEGVGHRESVAYGKKCLIGFGCLVQHKYYIVAIYKNLSTY